MNNEKLEEIGNKLNINEEDIKNIKKERHKYKIWHRITQTIIIIASIITGYLFGKYAYSGNTYPYINSSFVGIAGVSKGNSKFKRIMKINTIIAIILSIIGFIIAFRIGQSAGEVYGQGIEYGVYNRGEVKNY